ncbi:PqiC family protein [Pseudomonas sp. SP16.1]|uniref:PqiC family protein n=1 Tax=Pseudomonas sp. SP16.1 TaxID=3458854 RepID=UPI004045425D
MTVVRPLALFLTTLLTLSGCSLLQQKPVPLYQLDSGSAVTPAKDNGMAVLIGPVSIADYLRQEHLLQRQADGSLVAARDARWASGLANDIDQQLLRQLAWRLESQRLALAPAEPGFSADAQVMLTITRLDSGPSVPAVLEAQWRLLDRRGQLRDSRLVRLEEIHGGTMAEQVKAQSALLQRLVAELAVAIEPLAAIEEPTPEPQRKKPPVAKAKPQEPAGPKIPVAEPITIDTEVFRF